MLKFIIIYSITSLEVEYLRHKTSLKIYNNTIISDKTGYWFLLNVGGDGICQYWNNIEASNNLDFGEGVKMAYGSWNTKNNLIKTSNPLLWGDYFGFVNYPNGDLNITQNSIAVNAGYTYSGFNYDLDNNPINGIPDIGCYEYQSNIFNYNLWKQQAGTSVIPGTGADYNNDGQVDNEDKNMF